MYHFHDEQNVQNGAYGVVRGSFDPDLEQPDISQLGPSLATFQHSERTSPLWILTTVRSLARRAIALLSPSALPWKSLLEVAYVGSKSDYLSNYNNNFDQINDIGLGTMFNASTCPDSSKPPQYDQPCGWQTGRLRLHRNNPCAATSGLVIAFPITIASAL